MVELQTEGVAALCNILANRHVAYLADEVGLGKTMQALGVAAQVLHQRPGARILIIAPRESVQNGWAEEFVRFNKHVLRSADKLSLRAYDRLRDWLAVLPGEHSITLLRHPSFSRPVFLTDSASMWPDAVSSLDLPHVDTLHGPPPPCDDDAASRIFNEHFAKATNRWLSRNEIEFELVIVDEAQCLRHHENQSNTVLRRLLKGRVRNWLFMSATPAHSGVENIATLMNEYPESTDGPIVTPDMLVGDDDFMALKAELAQYMIRRPRTFQIGERTLAKTDYRNDDPKMLAMRCQSALDTLSIALVQKRLVSVLAEGGNRFRSGYLASFESLNDSLKGRTPLSTLKRLPLAKISGEEGADSRDDFYIDAQHPQSQDATAPDAGFLQKLSSDFFKCFRFELPHPKIDGVEADLRRAAFGDRAAGVVGGVKTLVFCRRLGSVRVLRQRLMASYLSSIEVRCLKVWGRSLNWTTGVEISHEAHEDSDDHALENEADQHVDGEADDGLNLVRVALREKGWLHRFSATFRDGQRNALVFEQNWFVRICGDAGIDPADAVAKIPQELWAEANAASLRAGKRYRRHQVRYLTWHALDRWSELVFGLDTERADRWKDIVSKLYSDRSVYKRVPPVEGGRGTSAEPNLLLFATLWSHLEAADPRLAFPGGARSSCEYEDELARQTLGNLLGQYLRLTDTLIDMRCADLQARESGEDMLSHFMRWLMSEDVDARRLRGTFQAWIDHRVLILSSAVGESKAERESQVCQESFDFLASLDPVVGVTGGSQGHKRAIQQFNMPGMPWVMVGTDTIREGVNLHLFCDRVMHYGIAWTAGDLEQRVGRVDRYFSLIERRLSATPADHSQVKLDVLYPHLKDTLERRQIEVVLDRKRTSDRAMASAADMFVAGEHESIDIDAVATRSGSGASNVATPFGTDRHLPRR